MYEEYQITVLGFFLLKIFTTNSKYIYECVRGDNNDTVSKCIKRYLTVGDHSENV